MSVTRYHRGIVQGYDEPYEEYIFNFPRLNCCRARFYFEEALGIRDELVYLHGRLREDRVPDSLLIPISKLILDCEALAFALANAGDGSLGDGEKAKL